jgi:hypothetical protein
MPNREEIETVWVVYVDMRKRAWEYFKKANARKAELRQLLLAQHKSRSKGGNIESKRVLEDSVRFEKMVEIRAQQDSEWLAWMDEHQFHQRLAVQEHDFVQLLMYRYDNGWS